MNTISGNENVCKGLEKSFQPQYITVTPPPQDFQGACDLMQKHGAVCVTEQEVTVSESGLELMSFLRSLLQPFLDSYQVGSGLTHLLMSPFLTFLFTPRAGDVQVPL